MIEEAFISGQLGKAIFADGGRYFLLGLDDQAEPVECRPMDVSAFFNFGAELKALSGRGLDLTLLRNQLTAQQRAHRTLTLIVSGMDDDLDDETRSAVVEEAARLMQDEATSRFVRARMLARPLPKEADVERALDIAIRSNATSVGILYQNLIDYEQAITLLHETWNETALEHFSLLEQQMEAEEVLTDIGAFADMASAVASGNLKALNSVVISYGQMPELKRVPGQGALVLNDLRVRLANKLTSTVSERKDRGASLKTESDLVIEKMESVQEKLHRFKNRRENPRAKTFKADEAKKRVDHQIEAISKLIVQGNINLADRYLGDLINFQVEHSEREHLGMSLCSLAKVAIDVQSFELAEKLVDYALMLGIDDVVINNTQSQMFKSMGDFDQALAVYEQTMERFPNSEVTRNGYADVLKSTGNLHKALVVYKQTIDRFPDDEVARNGYADVLKSTGNLDKALAIYEQTMGRFPNDEVARNGCAEVLKSTGDFDRAMAVYEQTIERFPNNEVAWNGYADVLKSTGDFDKALAVYEETMERFPNDQVSRGGYADVFKTMGDFDKALAVYEEAMERFPNDEVVRSGYADVLKSMGDFNKALAVYEDTIERFKGDRVSRNGYASVLLLMNRFEEARSFLPETAPRSKQDWIDYHVIAMTYLKEGDTEEAIRRLTYGLHTVTWPAEQSYFAKALAVAKIRTKEFAEVPKLLPTNVPNIDFVQRQTRLVLVGHSQAALGRKDEAVKTLAELERATNPRVINLKEAISRRYGLNQQSPVILSQAEVRILDSTIDEQEFLLAA